MPATGVGSEAVVTVDDVFVREREVSVVDAEKYWGRTCACAPRMTCAYARAARDRALFGSILCEVLLLFLSPTVISVALFEG